MPRATFPFGLSDFEVPSYGHKGRPLRYPRGRTGESEYDRETRLRQEMQMRLREQQFALPVQEEQMSLQNKMESEGWELKYNTAVRAQVAQWNEALQRLNRDPNISLREKEVMRQAIMQQMYGVEKTWTPPDPNKPVYPKGQGIGDFWMGEDGTTLTRDEKGIPKLVQRYDQGPEHHKMAAQQEWEKRRGELHAELIMAEEDVIETRDGKTVTSKKRKFENWEIQGILEAAGYGSGSAPLPQGAPQMQPQPQVPMGSPPRAQPAPARPPVVRPPQEVGTEYVGWARSMGVQPGKSEADLPPDVAMAQAFLNELRRRKLKGRKLDPNIVQAVVDAKATMARYDARGNR